MHVCVYKITYTVALLRQRLSCNAVCNAADSTIIMVLMERMLKGL